MPNTDLRSIVRLNEQTGVDTLDQLFNGMAISTEAAILRLRQMSPTAVNNPTQRSQVFPSPEQGDRCFRLDQGWEEGYFKEYSSSNPGGAAGAGSGTWIPIGGSMPSLDINGVGTNTHDSSGNWVSKTGWSGGTIRRATGGFGGSGIGNGFWSFPIPGEYAVTAEVSLGGSAGGTRGIRLMVDNSPVLTDLPRAQPTGSALTLSLSTHVFAPSGGVGLLQVFQDGGGTIPMTSAKLRSRFLGPA